MSLPHILPNPPVVVQDPARCWSAAFEIWSQANHQHFGLPLGPAQDDLIRWLSSGGGFLTSAGRARDSGVNFMGNVGLMRITRMPSSRLTPALVDGLLDEGYVYCAYYWRNPRGGRSGHAVVLYGAEAGGFRFSDPAPGRGLVREPANFFQRESVTVALGVSVLSGLRRGMQDAVNRLRPLSTPVI